jgi:hypothetical protein
VVARIVRPVLASGESAGADGSAVEQDDDATLPGGFLEGAVQARGTGRQQLGHFQESAVHGGRGECGDAVAARHVGKPLVMGEDPRTIRAIRPGWSLRQRERIFFKWARMRLATMSNVALDSGRRHWWTSPSGWRDLRKAACLTPNH